MVKINWKRGAKVGAGVVGVGAIGYGASKTLGGGNDSKTTSKTPKSSSSDTTGEEVVDNGTGEGSESATGSGDSNVKTKVVEVPIDNYEEAMDFATREWNKIKRNNGRTLECQVLGSTEWMVGEWCKVYMPTFDIDGYMYITRVSQSSEGGDWTCNLSLVDYPPGWGKEVIENNDEEEDSDSEDSEGGSGDGSSGDGTGDGSGESSDGNSDNGTQSIEGKNFNVDNYARP